MRKLILTSSALLALTALSGCAIFDDVYDERFEDECDEARNIDDRRACYNALEQHQYERSQEERRQDRLERRETEGTR